METYISLLLMIVPGFIASNIFQLLTKSSKKLFEIDSIIMSLIYGVFIMLLNFVCLSFRYGFSTIVDITQMFLSLRFIIKYAAITLVNSIYVALFWAAFKETFMEKINIIRKSIGKRNLSSSSSFLDALASDGYDHGLKVEQGGSVNHGMLKFIERDDDGKVTGVVLNHCERLKKRAESNGTDCLLIKQTYVALDSDLIISEYNSDDLRTSRKNEKWKLPVYGGLSFIISHAIIILISALIV